MRAGQHRLNQAILHACSQVPAVPIGVAVEALRYVSRPDTCVPWRMP